MRAGRLAARVGPHRPEERAVGQTKIQGMGGKQLKKMKLQSSFFNISTYYKLLPTFALLMFKLYFMSLPFLGTSL
jgi:hypothetical protein